MGPTGDKSAGGRARGTKALDNLQAELRERLESLVEDNRRLKRSAQLVHELLQALPRLSEAPELPTLCDQAVAVLISVFNLQGAAISVVEALDATKIRFARHHGLKAVEPDDLVFEADSSFIAALREGKTPLTLAALVGKTGPRAKERSILRRLECELVVPLLCRDRLLGVLLLTRHPDGSPLGHDQVDLITVFSSLFSVIVENTLLRVDRHRPSG